MRAITSHNIIIIATQNSPQNLLSFFNKDLKKFVFPQKRVFLATISLERFKIVHTIKNTSASAVYIQRIYWKLRKWFRVVSIGPPHGPYVLRFYFWCFPIVIHIVFSLCMILSEFVEVNYCVSFSVYSSRSVIKVISSGYNSRWLPVSDNNQYFWRLNYTEYRKVGTIWLRISIKI